MKIFSVSLHSALVDMIYKIFDKITTFVYYYFFLGGTVLIFFFSLFLIKYKFSICFVWLSFHYLMVSALSLSYHRYFTHKTFHANRIIQFFIALYGVFCLQRGLLWWCSLHRMHHCYCGTDQDPHTQQKGFFYCHFSWPLDPKYKKIQWDYIPDLAKFPELILLEYLYVFLIPLMSILLYWWGGWAYVLVYHIAITTSVNSIACLNSLCHLKNNNCEALNLSWLALLTLGEGLHRNHHENPSSAKISLKWFEMDITYLIIYLMKALRLVRDIKTVKTKNIM